MQTTRTPYSISFMATVLLDNHDPLSGIPGYKSIPVELEPSN